MQTITLNQTVELPGTPEEIYNVFVDAATQTKVIGAEATGGSEVGDDFTAWDGYIYGKHLELEPGKRLVQEWQTGEWPEDYGPSRFELTLEPSELGTKVTMVHSSVPADQADDYAAGWEDYYWRPIRSYYDSK